MNFSAPALALLSQAQQHYLAAERPLYYVGSPQVLAALPDNLLSLAAPVIAYWAASLFFHCLDLSNAHWLDPYRLHDSAEVKSRNLASRWDVFKAVVLQHIIQTLIGLWWMENKPAGDAVNHIAAMAGRAPYIFSLLKGLVGERAGTSLWLTHGHEMLYVVYWWAIPSLKFLFGM